VPVLGFTEQRLHPYSAFAQCLLVGEGATVTLDSIHVALLKVAQHLETCLVVGALGSHRAGVAPTRLGLVEDLVSGRPESLRYEGLARRTLVDVALRVVGELLLDKAQFSFRVLPANREPTSGLEPLSCSL
jgi:hypothetical protein